MITFVPDRPDESLGNLPCVFQEGIREDGWQYDPLITVYYGQGTLVVDTVGRVVVQGCPHWTTEMVYRLSHLANQGETTAYRLIHTSPLTLEELWRDHGVIEP